MFDLKKFDDDFTQSHVNQNSENTEDMLITPFVVVPKLELNQIQILFNIVEVSSRIKRSCISGQKLQHS